MKRYLLAMATLFAVMATAVHAGEAKTWPRDLYSGPGGGMCKGPGGGLYAGPGGGMYTGPCDNPYRSNIPPWPVFIKYLEEHDMKETADLIRTHMQKALIAAQQDKSNVRGKPRR